MVPVIAIEVVQLGLHTSNTHMHQAGNGERQ